MANSIFVVFYRDEDRQEERVATRTMSYQVLDMVQRNIAIEKVYELTYHGQVYPYEIKFVSGRLELQAIPQQGRLP